MCFRFGGKNTIFRRRSDLRSRHRRALRIKKEASFNDSGSNSIRALAKSKDKASTSEKIMKNDWASEVMCGAVANDWTKGSL